MRGSFLLARVVYRARSLQVVVIHHNQQGSNGKSTLFALVRKAFGALMVKCAASALVATANGGGSGPNEELASVEGARIVQFTEPSAKHKINVAFLKDLTGGDEQSASRKYEHKRTFVLHGMVHVLCNKIPWGDDEDGGYHRRLRNVPYGSRFLNADAAEGNAKPLPPHHYYKEMGLEAKFETWRYCLMREVLQVAMAKARDTHLPWHSSVPAVVVEATAQLIRRESVVAAFSAKRLLHTGDMRHILGLGQVVTAFSKFCVRKKRTEDVQASKNGHKDVKAQLVGIMGAITTTSLKGRRNYWRGWQLLEPPPMGEESDDEVEMDAEEEPSAPPGPSEPDELGDF